MDTTELELQSSMNIKRSTSEKFFMKLRKHRRVIKELISITKNVGNDLLVSLGKSEHAAMKRCDSPPEFDKILDRNATIIPMPIFLAYMPPVYFRIFSRIVLGAMDAEAMISTTARYSINLSDLHWSLSRVDQDRFAEVIKFFIKYQLVIVSKNAKTGDMSIKLNEPYVHFYCGFTVSAISTIAKTHMLNEKEFVANKSYSWKDWKKVKPIVLTYEDIFDGQTKLPGVQEKTKKISSSNKKRRD